MYIIVEGSLAVAVRARSSSNSSSSSGNVSDATAANGASALKDMALLGPGDTFGEVALMVSCSLLGHSLLTACSHHTAC